MATRTKTRSRPPVKSAAALNRDWSRWQRTFASFMARLDREKTAYLSHSKLSLFERCPRCYYRQYILDEKPDFPAMLLGTLFHKAAHVFYRSHSPISPTKLFARLNARPLDIERRGKLRNALVLLCQNRWSDCDVVSVEEPFFIDLDSGLPPVIGIPDLVLSDGKSLKVIDHKTSTKFGKPDAGQLVLYAEHLRRCHKNRQIAGFFDEYRLVSDLSTIRKPAFRRTQVPVDRKLLLALIKRYRAAWKRITALDPDDEPFPADDCWLCRGPAPWY